MRPDEFSWRSDSVWRTAVLLLAFSTLAFQALLTPAFLLAFLQAREGGSLEPLLPYVLAQGALLATSLLVRTFVLAWEGSAHRGEKAIDNELLR